MKRNWEDMTREELLEVKGRMDGQSQTIKAEMTKARRRVAMGQGHLPVAEYDALVEKQLGVNRALRAIQTALAKRKAERRAVASTLSFDQAFRKVAKLVLEQDLYDEIHTAADDMVSTEGAN
jgi:hypothetical protein